MISKESALNVPSVTRIGTRTVTRAVAHTVTRTGRVAPFRAAALFATWLMAVPVFAQDPGAGTAGAAASAEASPSPSSPSSGATVTPPGEAEPSAAVPEVPAPTSSATSPAPEAPAPAAAPTPNVMPTPAKAERHADRPLTTGTVRLLEQYYEAGVGFGTNGPLGAKGMDSSIGLTSVRVAENYGNLARLTVGLVVAMGQSDSQYVGSTHGYNYRIDYYRPLTSGERAAQAEELESALEGNYVMDLTVYTGRPVRCQK